MYLKTISKTFIGTFSFPLHVTSVALFCSFSSLVHLSIHLRLIS